MSSCNLHLAVIVVLGLLYIYISLLQNPSQLENMYFILLFLVVKLLALYSVKYNLNHLSTHCDDRLPSQTNRTTDQKDTVSNLIVRRAW